MKLTTMNLLLLGGLIFIIATLWRAHLGRSNPLNAFDLVMEDGKLSRVAFAFMLVLAVSTWVIADSQMKGKLDTGIYMAWLAAWVTPLVAKIVFNKNDMAGMVTSTTTTTSEVSVPAAVVVAAVPNEPAAPVDDRPV